MRTLIWPSVLLVAVSCSSPSTVAPISVPLQYKMMASPGEFPALGSCAAISDIRVSDARSDKTLGKRFVEGKNTPSAAVMTTSDVAEWARTGALAELGRAGVTTPKAGAPTLRISVDQIITSENVLHRAGYEGRVLIVAELISSTGTSCWKDRAEGFAENYGYAGSIENYQETLNHALDRAMLRLLNSPDFKKAICSC
jgi:hypothetical protein